MAELEAEISKTWASLFIDMSGREEILYSDFVHIFHSMFDTVAPGLFHPLAACMSSEVIS